MGAKPRGVRVAALVGLLGAVLGGCSVGATPPAPQASAPTVSGVVPTPSASAGVPAGTRPLIECLNRTYRLTGFRSADPAAAVRSGSGGDVELSFTATPFPDGNFIDTFYRLRVAGDRPISVVTATGTATVVPKVSVQGSYTLQSLQNPQSSDAIFRLGPVTGSATLTRGATTTRLSAAQVAAFLAPVGASSVGCTASEVVLDAENGHFELTRV